MHWKLLILGLFWITPALADSTVPALTSGTTLVGSTTYLAQGGALDRKLGFDTTAFGVSTGNLIVNTTTLGSTALTIGGTVSTIAGLTLTAPTINAATLTGTLGGTPTFSGNLTFSGVPKYTGLSAGTIASGKNLGLDSSNNLVTATVSGGTGCAPAGSSTQVLTDDGAGACTSNAAMTFATGLLSLGTNTTTLGSIKMFGNTSGNLTIRPAAVAGTNVTLTFPAGTTDFSATGGTSQFVKQASAGAALTVARPACADLSDAGAGCTGSGGTITVTANGNTETSVATAAFGTGFNVPGGSSGTAAITLAVVPVTDATASRTLSGTDGGKLIHMTNGAATAITLPDSATVTSKFGVNLVCDAGCTVSRAGSDTVNGGTSVVVAAKSWASIATDGAGVFLLGLGPGVTTGTGSMVQATSPTLVTPTIGVATATSVNKVALTQPSASATLTIADGKTLTDTSAVGAVALKGATGGGFAAATNNDLPGVSALSGTTHSLAPPREYWYCTGTCTVTPPVPAAGYEFCVANNIAVTSVITMAALGSSARYPKTDSSAYGTAGTGTMVAGGAAGDKICLVGLDSTHYNLGSYAGTWTVN